MVKEKGINVRTRSSEGGPDMKSNRRAMREDNYLAGREASTNEDQKNPQKKKLDKKQKKEKCRQKR